MEGLKKGLWNEEEDRILIEHVKVHGKGKWNRVAKITGLKRCGKSCRLRWLNYLRPEIKRGAFSIEEDELIIRLHRLLGNRWSLIAGRVPGRTDNQVKNHWNSHLKKRNLIDTNKGLIKVSSNASEENSSVSCRQMIEKAAKYTEKDRSGEEGIESWFWEWNSNCFDGSQKIDESIDPWYLGWT